MVYIPSLARETPRSTCLLDPGSRVPSPPTLLCTKYVMHYVKNEQRHPPTLLCIKYAMHYVKNERQRRQKIIALYEPAEQGWLYCSSRTSKSNHTVCIILCSYHLIEIYPISLDQHNYR